MASKKIVAYTNLIPVWTKKTVYTDGTVEQTLDIGHAYKRPFHDKYKMTITITPIKKYAVKSKKKK